MGQEQTAEESGSDRPRILLWLAWWVCFLIFYMLLAGTLVASELIAGAAAPAVAASVAELVRVQDARRFRPRLAWILRARRLPIGVVRDTFILFAALGATSPAGSGSTAPFAPFTIRSQAKGAERRPAGRS